MKCFFLLFLCATSFSAAAQNKCDSNAITDFMSKHSSVKSGSTKIGKVDNIKIEVVTYSSGIDTLKSISIVQAIKSFGTLLSANVVALNFSDIDTCISILDRLKENEFKSKPSGNTSVTEKVNNCISVIATYMKGFGLNKWQLQIVQSFGKEQQQELDKIEKKVSMPMNFFIILPVSEIGDFVKKLKIAKGK
jgi:hypothetical protein